MSTKYITFDDLGIVEIRCMHCNQVVARRKDKVVPRPNKSGGEILKSVLSHWSNWRQVRINLSDGSFADPIVCQDCLKLDKFDNNKLLEQIKIGWLGNLEWQGKSPEIIAEHKKKVQDLTAISKLTTENSPKGKQ